MSLLPGFVDPVSGAQATFRAVLDAMARPGRVVSIAADLTPPAPLARATAAVLLTLADADTPLWLAPAFAPARDWIAFHCGAPFVAPSAARVAVAPSLPDLAWFHAGSDETPEESATVIVQTSSLSALPRRGESEARPLCLTGPGIRDSVLLAVAGLPDHFSTIWARNHALFPRGVDLILCAGASLAALPRSVAVA